MQNWVILSKLSRSGNRDPVESVDIYLEDLLVVYKSQKRIWSSVLPLAASQEVLPQDECL